MRARLRLKTGYGAAAYAALRLHRLVGDDDVSQTGGTNTLPKVRGEIGLLSHKSNCLRCPHRNPNIRQLRRGQPGPKNFILVASRWLALRIAAR